VPKQYIIKKSLDILHLRNFYKKLIKLIIIFYVIIGIWLFNIINYNLYLTKNDYFVVTTFGKLIQIFPKK
jgi:hypothetical protein